MSDFAFVVRSPLATESSCGPDDHELFFSEHAPDVVAAKAICASCPVRVVCLAGALERGEEFGVWGGTDRVDRERMLRRAG